MILHQDSRWGGKGMLLAMLGHVVKVLLQSHTQGRSSGQTPPPRPTESSVEIH